MRMTQNYDDIIAQERRAPLMYLKGSPINPIVMVQLSVKITLHKFGLWRHEDLQHISRGKNLQEKSGIQDWKKEYWS